MKSKNLLQVERIFKLIEILKINKQGLTKQEIFHLLSAYYKQENEKSKERQFERDKNIVMELGYFIEITDKLIDDKTYPAYKISDIYESKLKEDLDKEEKEKLSNILLNKLLETKDKKYKEKLFILYSKLFYNDKEYLNQLLDNFKNYPFEELNNIINEFSNQKNKEDVEKIIKIFEDIKPLEIEYFKKNGEHIKRTIYPLIIHKRNKIFYLIAWDYNDNKLKNFIVNRINTIHKLNNKDFKKVSINPDLVQKNLKNPYYIEIPLKEVYYNIPHPFFIKKSEENSLFSIELKIKKEYEPIIKEYLSFNIGNFKQNIFYKITGSDEFSITLSFDLYNLEGLFRFISQFPDALIKFINSELEKKYKDYLYETYQFYYYE